MNKREKEQTLDALGQQFRSVNSAFLVDYRGLKVVDDTEIRRKIRDMNGTYVVVKNTLAMRAARETSFEQLAPHFEGPTAVVCHPKDVVGLAKLLTEIARTNPKLQFKAALVEGRVVPGTEVQAIASMPSREVMLGRLMFLLKAPLARLATVLKAPVRDLGLVLKEIKK